MKKTLSEVFTTVFEEMAKNYTYDWLEDPESLDLDYIFNHSGSKVISPLVESLLQSGVLSENSKQKLTKIIIKRFGQRWDKIYSTFGLVYNPIENYSMVEKETPAETTITNTPAETTNTITPAETTVTDTPAETTTSGTGDNDIYGFNSTNASHATTQSVDNSIQVDNPGVTATTVDTAGTSTITVQTSAQTTLEVDSERTLTRSGNIGVTTSQQMIQSERELWMYDFYKMLFEDIDTVLTLGIYN